MQKNIEEFEKLYEDIFIDLNAHEPGVDPTFENLKTNLLKLIKIFTNGDNYTGYTDVEYTMQSVRFSTVSLYGLLYNSIPKSSRIGTFYANNIKNLYVNNFLTDGFFPQLSKNFEDGKLDFHYYTYKTKKNPTINEQNYKQIFKNYVYIKPIIQSVVNEINESRFIYDGRNIYNFSNPIIHKIADYHFTPLVKKYKFEDNFYKKLSINNIIKLCLMGEEELLNNKLIQESMRKLKRKKFDILNKIKKSFVGGGSIWKFICSSDTLALEELQFIAEINGVQNAKIMTKQDICQELENLSLNKKNAVLASCENTDDIGGEEVKNIAPEYFYSYKIGDLTYCADIRSAYANIKSGNLKNPYTNVKLPVEIIEEIENLYSTLKDEEDLSEKTYSQDLADFTSKIPYLNSVELYKNASIEKIQEFADLIETELGEEMPIFGGNLEEYKHLIIKALIPNLDRTLYTVRSIYNEVFSTELQEDNESPISRPGNPTPE
jgi:hypothetical protein